MANIFGILTALVLGVAAFIAHKNKTAYELEITNTKTEKDRLAVSQARLLAAQEKLRGINEEIPVVNEQGDEFAKAEEAQKKTNESLREQIAAKTPAIEQNKAKLDEFRERADQLGDIKQLAERTRTLGAELEELSQSIASNEATLANLTSQNNAIESDVAKGKSEIDGLTRGESSPDLRTSIRSIYPSWGFVTLSSGGSAGVATNSTLDVVRGDEVIAKLLVTAVESNSSSATIIPDTAAEDVTLMIGDRVVAGAKVETKSGN